MKNPEKKEWTLMFYFASDNPLAPGIISQMKALKEAGFHIDANVIAQFDPHVKNTPTHVFEVNMINKLAARGESRVAFSSRDPFVRNFVLDKIWGDDQLDGGERIRDVIKRSLNEDKALRARMGGFETVNIDLAQLSSDLGNGDSHPSSVEDGAEHPQDGPTVEYDPPELLAEMSSEQSPKGSLSSFLQFCQLNYPARHYMLFILGHGLVVGNDLFLFDEDAPQSVVQTDQQTKQGGTAGEQNGGSASRPQNYLLLSDLGDVLEDFKKRNGKEGELELIGFHSCSMSALEVAYQIQGMANYMLASQGPAFVGSWPYFQILTRLFNDLDNCSFTKADVNDAAGLIGKLVTGKDQVSAYILEHLPAATIELLKEYDGQRSPNENVLDALVKGLNGLLEDPALYQEDRFLKVDLSGAVRRLQGQNMDKKKLQRFNYLLLTDAYPQEVPRINIKQALERMFQYCLHNSYDFQLAGYSFDLCLCDLNKVKNMTEPLGILAKALMEGLRLEDDERVKELILLAHWKAQSFWQESYTDLYDFCLCLIEKCEQGGAVSKETATALSKIKDACVEVKDMLEKATAEDDKQPIIGAGFVGPAYQYSHGFSIYFPWSEPHNSDFWRNEYANYRFKETSWGDFLTLYFEKTKRDSRGYEEAVARELKGLTAPQTAPEPQFQLDEDILEEITRHVFNVDGQLGKGGGNDATGDGKGGGNDPTGDDCNCPSIKNYPSYTHDHRKKNAKEKVTPVSPGYFKQSFTG
jgi:hypothetical protein